MDVHVWLSIGDYEERLVLQFVAQADAQAFGGPQRSIGVAEAGLFLGRGASGAEDAREMGHFVVKLIEELALRKRRGSVGLPGPKGAEPFWGAVLRVRQRPGRDN